MRLISLNAWGGKIFEPLLKFIRDESARTDVFCFQEIFFLKKAHQGGGSEREKIFFEVRKILNDFTVLKAFVPGEALFERKRLPDHLLIGEAIFTKKSLKVLESDYFITYDPTNEIFLRDGVHNGGCFQYAKISHSGKDFLVGNIHGLWQSDGKDDSPDRNYQTKKILDFFGKHDCGKILVGDFNIRPESVSIRTFSERLSNLIDKNKISKTRTNLYRDMEKYRDYISDYAFVSPEISVKNFAVPAEIVVSDHSPLILDFSI